MTTEVTGPDGTIIEFPDGMADADISAAMRKHYGMDQPAAAPGFTDRLTGNYKAAVAGGLDNMAEGASAVAAPESSMWQRAKGTGQAALGAMEYVGSPINALSKTVVGDPVTNVAKAAGVPDEYAQMIGNTADMAGQIISGGEIAKAAPLIAKGANAVGDAIAPIVKAIPKEVAPTSDAVFKAGKSAYKAVDNSGVVVSPESFQQFADQLPGQLKGYNSKLKSRATETNGILKDLANYATEEDGIKFSELADLRSDIGDAAPTASKNDKRLLRQVKSKLDDYITNLKSDDLDLGDATDLSAVQDSLNKGISLWRTGSRLDPIDKIMRLAASKKYPDRFVQQKFNAITSNYDKFSSYTPEEQEIIKKIANGGSLDTMAKWLAPSGDRLGWLKLATNSAIGGGASSALGMSPAVGAAVTNGAGMAAKAISEASRRAAVKQLQNTIALGRQPLSYLDRVRAARAAGRSGVIPPTTP